jgi:mannose-1-phosphate guanylyltransferase
MNTIQPKPRWAVILAGGDGTRLRAFTRSITGDDRPKQFCPVIGGETLLDQTRRRVAHVAPADQTMIVVTKSHERFYQPLAATLPRRLLTVQPQNKGTAPAILLPLLRIASLEPDALVGIFPSDHHFSDDQKFMSHVEAAFEAAQQNSEIVTLMGITPEAPEVEFGWIEPHVGIFGDLSRVRRFWEKPNAGLAQRLMERGCLWNSFVMVGRAEAFLKLTKQALPDLYRLFEALTPVFGTPDEELNLEALYSLIPEVNFSHEVLAARPGDLTVMRVGDVGWSDLGEPSRVLAAMSRMGVAAEYSQSAS